MKSSRTFYTPDDIAIALENIKKYDWARRLWTSTLNQAARWLDMSDEKVLGMVTPPSVPRAIYVHETGCPIHGLTIRKFGTYAWIISPDLPWKIRCPVGGEVYPSNDFEAYLKTGMKDRSLLTGKYPDDGWGWRKPEGDERKYWFIGYYNHWGVWLGTILPGLRDLGLSYLLTGDMRYAHKAAVLLWQIAQYYPEYKYEKQSRRGTEFDPNYRGKILYHTWENYTVKVVAETYDSIFPVLKKDKKLQRLTGKSGDEIQRDIEERLLREMARLIMDGSHTIQGNYGSHQCNLLKLAIILDDEENEPTKSQMIKWVLENDEITGYTDMGISYALYNIVFRDGVPFESPGYNIGWVESFLQIAEMLERLGITDLIKIPKFKMVFDWPTNLLVAGRFTPSLGDSGNMYAAGILPHPHLYETAYRWYKDFRYLLAKKLAKKLLSGGKSEKVYSNLFVKVSENLKNISEEICEPLGVKSFNFPAYGVAILQTGKKDNIIATTILYGRFFGHGHFDRLDLGIFAYGQVLLPDFGYPETCNPEDPRRFGFFSHTIGHNTVMVNQRRQQMEAGRLQTFDVTPNVKVVEVSAEDVYSGIVDCYRRNVMLVDAASSAYLIDVFRVEGGEQHDWIIHGTESEFTISGAPLSDAQREGTLAGKDVPYGQFYDDIIMRNSPYGTVSYSSYHGSGFQYLFNVQRAKIQKTCRVEWRCTGKGAERVNLTAFLVPKGTEELIICDGKPQNRLEMPETVKFVIRRRRGKDLSTVFVTVFEPYKEAPKIKRVDQLEIKPSDSTVIALKIEFPNFIDYYINAKDETKVYRIGQNIRFCGSLGLIRFNREGDVILAYLLNATELHCGNFSIRGSGIKHTKIANVDYRMGIITLTDPVLTRDLKGKWLIIHKNTYNSGYKIEEVINKKTFSIGNQSYIIGYATVQRINVKKGTIRTSMILPFAKPGMGLMSEDGQVKFKISSINKGVIKVEGNLSEKDFPDIDGDGKRTFYVVDFVVGDNVTIPSSILFTSPERNDDVSL